MAIHCIVGSRYSNFLDYIQCFWSAPFLFSCSDILSIWRCSTRNHCFEYNCHSCGCRNKHESLCYKTFKGIEDGNPVTIYRFNNEYPLKHLCQLGFLLVSTFGGLGVTASTFLTVYQVPLRVVSIRLLIWALCSIS